ncbi:conjugal transfer protein [Paraburkholderia largidicola]|nr:conjugal transfer protein [Paraburkholderia sp. PGU16]
MLKAEKLQSFEVSPGTIISLTLEIAAPDILVAGVVSNDVYDAYANLAIPKGSRLIGKQMRQVNDRQEVVWNGLQIPAYGGTLRLDPPIEATMPDGTSGLVDLVAGARASAIVGHPFIVPH